MKKVVILISIFLYTLSVFSQIEDKRIALIIGNSAYLNYKPINNASNDAELMATTLQNLGFTVIKKINLKRVEMSESITNFASKFADYNVALVYYSGHGIQIDDINYMVPVDAKIDSLELLNQEAVSEIEVLSKYEKYPNNTGILILDASRNNPFAKTMRTSTNKGLAPINTPENTFIACATSPGSVAIKGLGQISLFTEVLVEILNKPGLEIHEIFKEVRKNVFKRSEFNQTPWEISTLSKNFYFKKN